MLFELEQDILCGSSFCGRYRMTRVCTWMHYRFGRSGVQGSSMRKNTSLFLFLHFIFESLFQKSRILNRQWSLMIGKFLFLFFYFCKLVPEFTNFELKMVFDDWVRLMTMIDKMSYPENQLLDRTKISSFSDLYEKELICLYFFQLFTGRI